ncbi:hypothetical protein CANARDRAFT_204741 [[Candida] arabinofermentans NRRL YB-2248]|uniref:peptidyl-tRNA hydrolase n=1 Tax=[Candida] arabinofermentans NRRL YB-2248 TaxID=983967 RepID=A0A1E4STB1_9ASCO|nr:hypothetical protein CANARDRAFT_204741 [[Candida] arabinofermentans NRRL YB-2248]
MSTQGRFSIKSDKPPLLFIASLGNPSPSYDSTRHSVGHRILKLYTTRFNFQQVKENGFTFYKNVENDNIVCFKTSGYMNLSGKSLSKSWNHILKTKSNDYNPILIILHDEMDVELGSIKIRKQGSSHRGHNGLRNIQEVIGKGYTGIQIGIGRNYSGGDGKSRNSDLVSDYVLGKFKRDEVEVLETTTIEKFENIVDQMCNGLYIYDKQKN